MHINERDQVNYHGFLRALREMQGVSQESVAKGVCTVSGMNRFENGNRNAEKLMRDRLTSRLGISGEKYEDYLQPKEYVRWEQRLRIVNAIEKRDFVQAKSELKSYEALENLNRLNYQFIEAMRFNMMSIENAPEEELYACIKSAVRRTMPNVKKALAGAHLLADQEINLIAEQMRLCPAENVISDEKEWRISEYQKLITYIEKSQWEKLLKAKVYPKVTYYICKTLLEMEPTEARLRRGLELCHNAIELLRDCSRLYYFIELTETRRALATHLLNFEISNEEKLALEKMLVENNEWEKVFKELYTEYEVPMYMSDFCYLYYENESHNMVEIIETRRNMLGISRVRLSEGICSDRSIVRFEREGNNPCIEMVRCLFERLGMCAEYRRTQIVASDAKGLILYNDLINNVNGIKNIDAEICLEELQESINMNIAFNQQELERVENLLKLKQRLISSEELHRQTKITLERTLPIEAIERGLKLDCLYLTRTEVECVYDIAFYSEGNMSDVCRQYIVYRVNKFIDRFVQPALISTYELLLTRWASELGDSRNYSESSRISRLVLKECLSLRRMHSVAENIYNMSWNYAMDNNSLDNLQNQLIDSLEKCSCISHVIKDEGWETFFQNKLCEVVN